MHKTIFHITLGAIVGLTIWGCGTFSDLSQSDGVVSTVVSGQQPITGLKMLDANGNALVGAKVSVSTVSTSAKTAKEVTTFMVGEDGIGTVEGLENGIYILSIEMGGQITATTLDIGTENFQSVASVMASISAISDTISIVNGAIIASISGTVGTADNTPIENAQVRISGGDITNGTLSAAVSDASGRYELLVNVKLALMGGLSGLEVTASAEGYSPSTLTATQILSNINQAGFNFRLEVGEDTPSIYIEDFETASSDSWTINKLAGNNNNNMWHIHTNDVAGLISTAYTYGLVSMAPNDKTAGAIPPPKGTKCFWYGNGAVGEYTFGSYIGQLSADSNPPLSGGSGQMINAGELVSPEISVTTQSGIAYLVFDTYWEIESVNPNSSGFDIMEVALSTDNGVSWNTIARLNPLSDPQTDVDRSPIPFSNTGYNSGPKWLTQEGITLIDDKGASISGKKIRLKFTFSSEDELYNGFRGWMVDNIKIKDGVGTFPAYTESFGKSENSQKSTKTRNH